MIAVVKKNCMADGGFFIFVIFIVNVFDEGVILFIVILFNVWSILYELTANATPLLLILMTREADVRSEVSGRVRVAFLTVLSLNPNTYVYAANEFITELSALTVRV